MSGRDGLRVRILGRLDACDGDVEIDLGGRRQRAVLAVLVLARGETVPAERIADCLWGDDLPGNASGAVQSYVSHLRRQLQPDGAPRSRGGVIVSEGAGYAVRLPPDAVDAWSFERLVREAATGSAGGDPRRVADLLSAALERWRGRTRSPRSGGPAPSSRPSSASTPAPRCARSRPRCSPSRPRSPRRSRRSCRSRGRPPRRPPPPRQLQPRRQLGGGYALDGPHPDAFSHRSAAYSLLTVGIAGVPGVQEHAGRLVDALRSWHTGRVWPNFAPPHDAASARRAYDPATLARIADIVETYDPHGVLQAGSYTRG